MAIDPLAYVSPQNTGEAISFANAIAYEWAYLDTMREVKQDPIPIPDGWAHAWLEYGRRNTNRMAIREAFRHWRAHGTLPGLS
ncbi:hypothetical protein [Saccharopolyspora hattusasensis]|uniref:hypothetical protein n=1 Tax=Saccharopolyspora hattusasensis TaxID=1128679 RepID=UPI003D98A830